MAKPNLTSIFTSSNQYSVLKLLKALCDAVDNIDYADNTEFTNFKEQVNTAVASLANTDTSLQEQIDSNNSLINDVNTQVSVIERPNANTTVVNKGITIKDNGDVTVGRNLEVNGKTKLNNGFTFIHTYPVSNTQNINIMFEEYLEGSGYYGFVGILSPSGSIGSEYLCIGTYLEVGAPYKVVSLIFIDNADFDKLKYAKGTADGNALAVSNVTPDVSTLQPKLYRHVITLHAISTSDGSCRLEWISPKDLVCDSLQDLRTVLGNPQMQSYVASNPSGDLFGVVISLSTAQIKKVGTTSLLNITSVSDTVTPL